MPPHPGPAVGPSEVLHLLPGAEGRPRRRRPSVGAALGCWAAGFWVVSPAFAGVVVTVSPGSEIETRTLEGATETCENDRTIGPAGGSASCSKDQATARGSVTITSTPGSNGLPTLVVDADVVAEVGSDRHVAVAELDLTAVIGVSDRAVRYHLDFNPQFGGLGQTNDSSGSVRLSGHGELDVPAGGVPSDTLERDGILGVGDHSLSFFVDLRASDNETIFARGVLTMTFQPVDEFRWIGGDGDYSVEDNWDPRGVPTLDAQFSDTAIFPGDPAGPPVTVAVGAAKAARWIIEGMNLVVNGAAETGPHPDGNATPDLAMESGSLSIVGGAVLTSNLAALGLAGGPTLVTASIRGAGSEWAVLDRLFVGLAGPSAVVVDDGGLLNVDSMSLSSLGAQSRLNILGGGRVLAGAVEGFRGATIDMSGRVTLPSTLSIDTTLEGDGLVMSVADGAHVSSPLASFVDSALTIRGVDGGGSRALFEVENLLSFEGRDASGVALRVLDGGRLKSGGSLIGGNVPVTVIVNNTASGLPPFEDGVAGTGAVWDSDGTAIFDGIAGAPAELVISDRGVADLADTRFGAAQGALGRAGVTGAGSVLTASSLVIGDLGRGELTISDRGHVSCGDAFVGTGPAPAPGQQPGFGLVTIHGGLFLGTSLWEITDDLSIGGGGSAGGLVILNGLSIGGAGEARVSVGSDLTVGSRGTITGTGTLAAGNRVINNGGIISPGLSPGVIVVEGDYEQTAAGVLVIEVAGLGEGEFDILRITGDATLAGGVDLRFIDGFVPRAGQSIDFLDVAGTVTGALTGAAVVEVPGTPGGEPGVRAEIAWEVTPDGTGRFTVARVTPLDAKPRSMVVLEPVRPAPPGPFRFLLRGPSGTSGRVQRSLDLTTWSDWLPFVLTDSPLEVADPDAVAVPVRYYRVAEP